MSRICAAMRLHQLKFSCGDARRRCAEFGSRFRLQVTDQGNDCDFLAMRGQVVFSFTQVDGVARDTLSEVVFHVQDLKSVVSRAEINGANIITPNDKSRMTVGCPVGNLQLTFCQCVDCQCLKSQVADVFSHVDHITLAVEPGSSSRMLEWFEKCFNFLRFPMNPQEMDEGLSIYSTDTGLRLLALQYWHCSEVGLRTPSTSKDKCDVKFVIAEPLVGNGPNQVAAFLEEHGGPGVQHVGLCTSNIVEAMDQLREAGVEFIQPPAEYYEQVWRIRPDQLIFNTCFAGLVLGQARKYCV